MKRSTLSLAVCAWIVLPALTTHAATSNELKALENRSYQCMKTKEGKQYHDNFFKVMESTLNGAMEGCLERTPDTKDDQHPAEFLFVVGADGRLKKLVYSTDIPFGQCVGPKLRSVKNLPRPPGDNWVVLVGLANNHHRLTGRGPADEPRQTRGSAQIAAFDKSIAPYVAKARATYPAAKKRFIAGLPKGYRFFIQLPLYDPDGTRESCFIFVESIRNGKITGTINSHVDVLSSYKTDQRITFPESDITNWLILRPDGVEEGNYVGKFLDHYKPQ